MSGRGAAGGDDERGVRCGGRRATPSVRRTVGNKSACARETKVRVVRREGGRRVRAEGGPRLVGPWPGARGTAGVIGEAAMHVDESGGVGGGSVYGPPSVVSKEDGDRGDAIEGAKGARAAKYSAVSTGV